MKKPFALLLALMLLFSLLPRQAARAEEECQLIVQTDTPEAGTVNGGGHHPVGVPIPISAKANEGWLFVRWDTILLTGSR